MQTFVEQSGESDDILNDDDRGMLAIIGELGEDDSASISVYRAIKGRSKGAYIFRCIPSEFSLPDIMDKLRDEYGGGDFRIVVSQGGLMRKNSALTVEKPRAIVEQAKAQAQAGDVTALIMQIQESSRAQAESMRDMMLQQAQENSRMLLEIIKSTSGAGNSGQPSMIELVQTITALKALDGGTERVSAPEKMLEMFFKGMEIGKEQGEGGGEKSILSEAIAAFAPSLTDIVKQMQQLEGAGKNAQSTQVATVQNNQARVVQKTPNNIQKTTRGEKGVHIPNKVEQPEMSQQPEAEQFAAAQQLMTQFAPYIQMFINASKINADPEVYANLICDQLDDTVIAEWIVAEEKYEVVLSYLPPDVNLNHRDWFDDLRLIVVALVQSDLIDGEAEESGVSASEQHGAEIPPSSGDNAAANKDLPNAG